MTHSDEIAPLDQCFPPDDDEAEFTILTASRPLHVDACQVCCAFVMFGWRQQQHADWHAARGDL